MLVSNDIILKCVEVNHPLSIENYFNLYKIKSVRFSAENFGANVHQCLHDDNSI